MKTNESANQNIRWHSFLRNFTVLTTSSLFAVILSLPAAIFAQAEVTVDEGDVVELEEFTIEGILRGPGPFPQERAGGRQPQERGIIRQYRPAAGRQCRGSGDAPCWHVH